MINLQQFKSRILPAILVGSVAFFAGFVAAEFGLSSVVINRSPNSPGTQVALIQATIESLSKESTSEWGSPQYLRFQNNANGIFTATIDNAHHISNSGIYLPINSEYSVQVWYLNLTATYLNFDWHQCIPTPETISVSTQQQQYFHFTC